MLNPKHRYSSHQFRIFFVKVTKGLKDNVLMESKVFDIS